ncbi:oocyte zinc finger protein XlCOF7.1-like, partial [Pollicipes pollicipes]|uniref:oocyte zinc finger protein XlCOF7.1-like n=1 Tax=Pollicipes pollicipes TaxID=41117 RepID=UPI0018849207
MEQRTAERTVHTDYEMCDSMTEERNAPSEEAPAPADHTGSEPMQDDQMSDCGTDTGSLESISDLPDAESGQQLACPSRDCEQTFLSPKAFTQHLRSHNKSLVDAGGQHACGICQKPLSSAASLDRHMLTHTGYRPFCCRLCGLRFTTNGNMHRHLRGSHCGEEGARRACKRRGSGD